MSVPQEKRSREKPKTSRIVPTPEQMISRRLGQIQEEMKKIKARNEEISQEFKDYAERSTYVLDEVRETLEDFEESMMYIMHNIKKNQFLYAHYPEEWVNSYLDIKNGMKYENEFMDKQFSDLPEHECLSAPPPKFWGE